MRNIFLVMAILVIIADVNGQSYCIPNPTYGTDYGDFIDSVSLAGTNIYNNGAQGDTSYVFLNTTAAHIKLNQRGRYNLIIKAGNTANATYSAWIDYDRNSTFEENEKLGSFTTTYSNQIDTIEFVVLDSIDVSFSFIRIRCTRETNPDACSDYDYGETEDYLITEFPRDAYEVNFFNDDVGETDHLQDYWLNENCWFDMDLQLGCEFIYSYAYNIFHDREPTEYITSFNQSQNGNSNYFDELATTSILPININNDGYIDIIAIGDNNQGFYTKVYLNNNGTEFIDTDHNISIFKDAYTDKGDIDKDGDDDLLISGNHPLFGPISIIYQNQEGKFIEKTRKLNLMGEIKYIPSSDSSCFIIGNKLCTYKNNQILINDTFSASGSIAIADVNLDNRIDFAIGNKLFVTSETGYDEITLIDSSYTNSFADYDNDGMPDLLHGTTIFRNGYGGGIWQDIITDNFTPTPYNFFEKHSYFVFNNTGSHSIYSFEKGIYQSDKQDKTFHHLTFDRYPLPEITLGTPIIKEDTVILRWNKNNDGGACTYNVYIGSQAQEPNIVRPYSIIEDGRPLLFNIGNAGHDSSYTITGLPEGKYYYGVQLIRYSGNTSVFYEDIFIVKSDEITQNTSLKSGKYPIGDVLIADFNNDGIHEYFQSLADWSANFGPPQFDYGSKAFYYDSYPLSTNVGIINYGFDEQLDIVIHSSDNSISHPGGELIYFTPPLITNYNELVVNSNDNEGTPVVHEILALDTFLIDFDNDGNVDILKGRYILINQGTETYDTLPIVSGTTNSFPGDYNNDGLVDIICYKLSNGYPTVEVMYNNGNNTFNSQSIDFMLVDFNDGLESFKIKSAHIDNDFNLDMLAVSAVYDMYYSTQFNYFKFEHLRKNLPPNPPINLIGSTYGSTATLSWDYSQDPVNENEKLTYNIRIGTSKDTFNILPPYSNNETGFRRIPRIGNAGFQNTIEIDSLAPGKYYWSVQSIDNTFTGSQWAPLDSFEISMVSAKFSFDTVCLEAPTPFEDLSVGNEGNVIDSWEWNFGDGNSSTLWKPTHIYSQPGKYLVNLTVHSGEFFHSYADTVLVLDKPQANFSAPAVCDRSYLIFNDQSITNTVNVTSYIWDFGDGNSSFDIGTDSNLYAMPGEYTASLTISSENGCTDTYQQTVTIAEYPDASINLGEGYNTEFCFGDSTIVFVDFVETYNYQWRLNNGDILGIDSLIIKKNSGNYSIEVENPNANCISSDFLNITVFESPSPLIIENESNSACDGDSILLSIPWVEGYTYEWKREGGFLGIDTTFTYAREPGKYTVEIAENHCKIESSNSVLLDFRDTPNSPSINADGKREFCEGESVDLYSTLIAGLDYQWYNSNGIMPDSTSSKINISESGEYYLIVTNQNNCTSMSPETITIDVMPMPEVPKIIYGSRFEELCDGDSLLLSAIENQNLNYTWYYGSTQMENSTFEYYAKQDGVYRVEASTSFGCSRVSVDSVMLNVLDVIPDFIISNSDKLDFCEGDSVILTSFENPELSYQWYNGDILLLEDTLNTMNVFVSGHYFLKVTNKINCSKLSNNQKTVTVYPIPDKPIINVESQELFVCPSDSILLSPTSINENYSYLWRYNGDIISEIADYYNLLSEGAYSVICSSYEDCSTESDKVNVNYSTDLDKPEVTVFGPNIWYLGCHEDKAYTYRWYYNGELIEEETDQFCMANQNFGTYQVAVNDGSDCWVYSDLYEIPSTNYKSSEGFSIPSSVDIFPNPASNAFNIRVSNKYQGEVEIYGYNLKGQLILNEKINKHEILLNKEFDVHGLPEGTYQIKIKLGSTEYSKILILSK